MDEVSPSPALPDKNLFRPDEVASLLNKSTRTVYRMIQTGTLPATEKEGVVRITREELRRVYECRGTLAKK